MKTAKVLGLDVPWQLQQLADAGNRAAPFAALHESGCGRLCCKSRFALVIKNSAGCRRGFRVRMRGTSSPHVKLLFLMPGEHSTFTAVRALWPMGPASSSATAAICCSMKRPVGPSILRQVAGGRTVVSSAPRRDPHDADSVADHVGGALLAFGAL